MKFCGNCENMYYISINESNPHQLCYYCRHCGERDADIPKEGVCVTSTAIRGKSQGFDPRTLINQYTKMDPTLPRISNIPCPNEECSTHSKAKTPHEVLYLRYDHNDMKYLYMCCVCDTVWE